MVVQDLDTTIAVKNHVTHWISIKWQVEEGGQQTAQASKQKEALSFLPRRPPPKRQKQKERLVVQEKRITYHWLQ